MSSCLFGSISQDLIHYLVTVDVCVLFSYLKSKDA